MTNKDRFGQCFTCAFLDSCYTDDDDEHGNCKGYEISEEWNETYIKIKNVIDDLLNE